MTGAFNCNEHGNQTNSYRVWKQHLKETSHPPGSEFIIAGVLVKVVR